MAGIREGLGSIITQGSERSSDLKSHRDPREAGIYNHTGIWEKSAIPDNWAGPGNIVRTGSDKQITAFIRTTFLINISFHDNSNLFSRPVIVVVPFLPSRFGLPNYNQCTHLHHLCTRNNCRDSRPLLLYLPCWPCNGRQSLELDGCSVSLLARYRRCHRLALVCILRHRMWWTNVYSISHTYGFAEQFELVHTSTNLLMP